MLSNCVGRCLVRQLLVGILTFLARDLQTVIARYAPVFSDKEGEPLLPNNLTRRCQDVCAARGLQQVTCHVRHSHASALIAAGIAWSRSGGA